MAPCRVEAAGQVTRKETVTVRSYNRDVRRALFIVLVILAVSAACSPSPTRPDPATEITPPASLPPPAQPFTLSISPETNWVGVGRQSGNMNGILSNNTGWHVTIKAAAIGAGSIKKIDQALVDRETRAVLGTRNETGPFYSFGNTPNRVVDALKTYGSHTIWYVVDAIDFGYTGRPADLLTTAVIEDVEGRTWTLQQTSRWEFLAPPVSRGLAGIVAKQNDPASGCAFDPVHGYGYMLELAWDPPPPNVPVTKYSIAVTDRRGADLIIDYPDTTSYRLVRCGAHIGPEIQHDVRFGVRTYHAPSNGMSSYVVTKFDFPSCRDAGVPACR